MIGNRRNTRSARAVLLGLGAVLLAAALPGAEEAAPGDAVAVRVDSEATELEALIVTRDVFALRDRLERPGPQSAARGYAEALAHHAFNRLADSNELLDALLADAALPPERRRAALRLRMANDLRQQRYASALASAEQLLALPHLESERELRDEVANTARLLVALADVPPQKTEIRAPTRVTLDRLRRVPVRIGDEERRFTLDTGANFSVIGRSDAAALGLAVRPVGLRVQTSTGRPAAADVAVAPRLSIGNVFFENVVFLVFPDELLTFADGTRISGLVGFPLVEAMGEVRFRRDDVLEVPLDPPRRREANLALDGKEPLVRVRYRKNDLVCRLDTGAGRTVFYEPFYRRFHGSPGFRGQAVEVAVGGVGGRRTLEAFRLPRATLTFAAVDVTLRLVDVYKQPLVAAHENYLMCNLGLDALERFRSYTISFRDMALVLR